MDNTNEVTIKTKLDTSELDDAINKAKQLNDLLNEAMEITRDLISLSEYSNEDIENGKVKCPYCQKGHYKPLDPKSSPNYTFVCDACGQKMHVVPNIDI